MLQARTCNALHMPLGLCLFKKSNKYPSLHISFASHNKCSYANNYNNPEFFRVNTTYKHVYEDVPHFIKYLFLLENIYDVMTTFINITSLVFSTHPSNFMKNLTET